jgi:hypothetical protein
MNQRIVALWLVCSLFSSVCLGGQTAQATLWCDSMRFQRGIDQEGLHYLDLTSLSSGLNGELTLDFFQSGYTHSTFLELADNALGRTLVGMMVLNVPLGRDVNRNGINDFFEVSQAVEQQNSSGKFELQVLGAGLLTATWNRSAGSREGTCVLELKMNALQTLVFAHGFELLQFTGQLEYTPGETNVLGNLKLQQDGNRNNLIHGPMRFVKSPSAPFDQLVLEAGTWTNTMLQELHYAAETYRRDLSTNYHGYLTFEDGDPATAEADYQFWNLSIDDPNDQDEDGVPDFSDEPRQLMERRPTLTLALASSQLAFTISGDVGRAYHIQQSTAAAAMDWVTCRTVTLTNDPQTVHLPLPAGLQAFYRVMTPE